MKKLLKRKVNVFGKAIPVFVIALFAITLVSAALVPYLSDKVAGNFNVDNPFEIGILGEGQTTPDYAALGDGPVTITDVHGGDTVTVTVGFKSLTEDSTEVIENFIISAVDPEGPITTSFSCEDFESISWQTCTDECTIWDTIQTLDMTSQCKMEGTDIVIPYPNSYDAGEINVDMIELKLKLNALGDYAFNAQIVPVTVTL